MRRRPSREARGGVSSPQLLSDFTHWSQWGSAAMKHKKEARVGHAIRQWSKSLSVIQIQTQNPSVLLYFPIICFNLSVLIVT